MVRHPLLWFLRFHFSMVLIASNKAQIVVSRVQYTRNRLYFDNNVMELFTFATYEDWRDDIFSSKSFLRFFLYSLLFFAMSSRWPVLLLFPIVFFIGRTWIPAQPTTCRKYIWLMIVAAISNTRSFGLMEFFI